MLCVIDISTLNKTYLIWFDLIWRGIRLMFVMSYLRCFCLFTYSGIHGTCGVLFVLLLFVSCSLYMLSVSLDCPCLIAPSVFSNIYCTRPKPLVIFIVLSHCRTLIHIIGQIKKKGKKKNNTDPTKNRGELKCSRRVKIINIFSITFHVILMPGAIFLSAPPHP
jgi:hypothetical protein